MSERNLKPVAEESNVRFIRATKLAKEGFRGEVVRGLYKSSAPNKLNKGRLDYTIEDEATGAITVVNGAGNLGYQMAKIPVGSFLAINYNGMSKITSGDYAGTDAHSFTVLAENLEDSEESAS